MKKPPGKDADPINASLYLSPRTLAASKPLQLFLEWETHKRALPSNALWYALYRAGLIDEKTPERAKRAAAMKFLGFVPVSPDDAPYRFDARTGEVVNERHGSQRRPKLHSAMADTSPIARFLEQYPSLRVDMRFREDGLHATLTIERTAAPKKAD